jgi:hypothetical protein
MPRHAEARQPTASVFEKVCAACHKFGSLGRDRADLSTLASRIKKALRSHPLANAPSRTSAQMTMIESATAPSSAGWCSRRTRRAWCRDRGRARRAGDRAQSQIKIRQKSSTSLMPEDLLNEFTVPQVASLVAFLFSPPPR